MDRAITVRMMRSTEEASFEELDQLSQVPLDEALDALSHVQRRKLLFGLLDRQDDSPIIVDDSREWTGTPEQTLAMYHAHLPNLASHGFVDWNRETDEVSRGPNFDDIAPLLKLLNDHKSELPDNWL